MTRFGAGIRALLVVACAICAPAKAQVTEEPSALGASADAVYSNLGTFRNQSFAAGGATQQVFNTITRLAADDLNLAGTPPYSVNGFRFTVTNLNAVDVSARMLVRFWLPDGPGGGPGTLIEARTYNPIVFTAGRVGTIKTSSQFVLPSSHIWAGIAFDNNSGTTGATAAQLDNLAQGVFSPPELGTSTDLYFVTTAAGSFASDNPVGTLTNFGGAPPADFGWEILTAQDVDLSITKSDGVATAFPGGSVTYTITASNAGPDTVFGARVVDAFSPGLVCSWTCAGSAGNTCAASGAGNINDATVGLAAGGSVTYTATCAISPTATGTLMNTASIIAPGTAVDTSLANNSATDIDAIVPGPDLTIAKSHAGNFVQGQPGTYSLTVGNAGGSPTTGPVALIDNVPVGLVPTFATGTGWTCNIGAQGVACNRSDPLAPGASYPPITLTVAVAGNAPASVTNTAIVFGGGEVNPSNNTASDPTTITAGPNLTIAKSHAGNFTQGQTGTYTLTVSNTGGSPTSGPVTVTDTVPTGLSATSLSGAGWNCTVATTTCSRSDALSAGASYPPITLTVDVAPNAPPAATNTAQVAGGGDVDSGDNTASDPTTITAGPNLTLAKSHTGNFTQGQTGTYTLTVSNTGGSPTTGSVTVTDSLPSGLVSTSATGAGWLCAAGGQSLPCARSDSLALGASYPPITLTVAVAVDAPASVTNTAMVFGGGDVDSSNDSASDPTTIVAVADLTLTKTHTGSFLQGQVGATYALTVSNVGGGPTSGLVTVSDTLPADLTPTAAAGAGWVCNIAAQAVSCTRSDALGVGASYPAITLTVNVAPAAPPSLTNTATVSGGGEINAANSTASDVTTIGPGPDLTIGKSHSGNFFQGQAGATYTITVSNPGPAPGNGVVTATDNVPAGLVPTNAAGTGWTCNISGQDVTCTRSDPLASGQSYPPITLTVDVAPGAPGSVTNAVTVSGGGDVNPANNSDTDVTTIVPGADLTIAKSHTGDFTQGQTGATYTVTVTNSGVGSTTGMVAVADALPLGLTPTAATGAGWSCSTGAQTVSCSRSDALTAGASHPPITITLNVAANAPPTVTNVAGVAGGGDSNAANNTASDATTIVPGPDLTIAKTHAGNFTQGQTGTYTLSVSNTGGSPTSASVAIIDNVPIGLVPTSAAGTGWTCDVGAQAVACNRGDPLAPGGSYPPIALAVAVAVDAPASVTNTAIVFGGGDTNPANNAAPDPTTIAAGPDLTIAKSHTGNFTQGQTGTYTLTVSNTGGSPTSGSVAVIDDVPIGLVPLSASGAGWTCNVAAQGVACNRSDPLAPGGSYPPIALTVAVAANAPASVTNTANAFGGGETDPSNNAATDPTTIAAGPNLIITKSHAGDFAQGQTGATYTVTVGNTGGAATTGSVTVADTVPAGLSATNLSGTGWSCSVATATCSRSDALNAGASYPPITITVDVASDAPPSVTNIAEVSGGGDVDPGDNTASDPTLIAARVATQIPTLWGPVLALLLLLVAATGAASLRARGPRNRPIS